MPRLTSYRLNFSDSDSNRLKVFCLVAGMLNADTYRAKFNLTYYNCCYKHLTVAT